MTSAERLKAAVDALEASFTSGNMATSSTPSVVASSDESAEVASLRSENAKLKETQQQAKKRLDVLIQNMKKGA